MKNRKVILTLALAAVSITFAACGKEASVEPDTEVALVEMDDTESVEVETEETEEGYIAQYNEDGVEMFPEHEETYIHYESIDPVEKYLIADAPGFYDLNIDGTLQVGGGVLKGTSLVFDGKCEFEGIEYYKTVPNNNGLFLLYEASLLADEAPSEDSGNSGNNGNSASNSDSGEYGTAEELAEMAGMSPDEITYSDDLPEAESYDDWSTVPDKVLDDAANMILQ